MENKIRLTIFEHTLILAGLYAGELPDFNGNRPIPRELPPRRPVSVEEFEADMRASRAR